MNMTEDIDECLSNFKHWLDQFKAVTHLLHENHLRQRYVARCVLGTQHSHLAFMFKSGVRSAAKWRWGTVLLVLEDLLPLQTALRSTWDPEKFLRKEDDLDPNPSEPRPAAPDSCNLPAVTAAIRSSLFWSYSHMLFTLNDIAGHFAAWVEGCDCHAWLRPSQSGSGAVQLSPCARRLKVVRTHLGLPSGGIGDGPGFVCPLAGKRAPELARGKHKELVPHLCAESLPNLLVSMMNVGTSEAEKAVCLNDFELGKHRMLAVLLQKTLFWGVLPWSLAGVVDHDERRSRQTAQALMHEFDACPDTAVHHRVTLLWLGPGPLRSQLESYVAGNPLVLHPLLARHVAELRLVPVAERIQEADLSLIHRKTKHRTVSGAYVSLQARTREIETIVSSPADCAQFVEACSHVRDVAALAKALGIARHPLLNPPDRTPPFAEQLQRINFVMYTLDAATQFAQMKAIKKKRERHRKARERQENQWKRLHQRDEPVLFSKQEATLRRAVTDHLRKRLVPGRMYSITASAASWCGLSHALQPLPPNPNPASVSALADQAMEPLSSDVVSNCPAVLPREPEAPEGANRIVSVFPPAAFIALQR